jgi:hypothetical protein
VGAFIFGVEPEINAVIFYRETFIQRVPRRTGCNILKPVSGAFYHFIFELIHIKFIGISFFNIEG